MTSSEDYESPLNSETDSEKELDVLPGTPRKEKRKRGVRKEKVSKKTQNAEILQKAHITNEERANHEREKNDERSIRTHFFRDEAFPYRGEEGESFQIPMRIDPRLDVDPNPLQNQKLFDDEKEYERAKRRGFFFPLERLPEITKIDELKLVSFNDGQAVQDEVGVIYFKKAPVPSDYDWLSLPIPPEETEDIIDGRLVSLINRDVSYLYEAGPEGGIRRPTPGAKKKDVCIENDYGEVIQCMHHNPLPTFLAYPFIEDFLEGEMDLPKHFSLQGDVYQDGSRPVWLYLRYRGFPSFAYPDVPEGFDEEEAYQLLESLSSIEEPTSKKYKKLKAEYLKPFQEEQNEERKNSYLYNLKRFKLENPGYSKEKLEKWRKSWKQKKIDDAPETSEDEDETERLARKKKKRDKLRQESRKRREKTKRLWEKFGVKPELRGMHITLGGWLSDRCYVEFHKGKIADEERLIASTVRGSSKVLYESYQDWCEENAGKLDVLDRRPFTKLFEKYFPRKRFTNGMYFIGVDLRKKK